jgi:hypothetical protein
MVWPGSRFRQGIAGDWRSVVPVACGSRKAVTLLACGVWETPLRVGGFVIVPSLDNHESRFESGHVNSTRAQP